jgi:coenzyme F420-reducing hydrogenase alpha subunit
MKIFRTEMMNWANYTEYMRGGYNYKVYYYDVEAETKEDAIAIAKKDNPNYYINTYAREVEKKEYTTTEKDRLIARIAELEEILAACKKDLENLEKGVDK